MDVATVEVWDGADAVLKAVAYIDGLIAAARPIDHVVADPMRFASELLRFERDHNLVTVEWPQSESRMTICSETLHAMMVEQRLRHPGVAVLDRHVGTALVKPTQRGWRLVKAVRHRTSTA